jgi:protein-arginine deiminase
MNRAIKLFIVAVCLTALIASFGCSHKKKKHHDTIPPTVIITTPTSDPAYATSNATIDIAGTASDAKTVDSVTWSNDQGGSGSCSGTDSWSKTGITLYDGVNLITVTAYDAANNSGTGTLAVTYLANFWNASRADIVADYNRDGKITIEDDVASGAAWTHSGGAVSVPNDDDDDGDMEYDISDNSVNGMNDATDLARFVIRQYPTINTAWHGEISVAGNAAYYVVFHRYDGSNWTFFDHLAPAQISGTDLAAGQVTFGMEVGALQGTNKNEPGLWNGLIDITFTIKDGSGVTQSSDTVRFYNSPYIMLGNLHPTTVVHVARFDYGGYNNSEFINQLQSAVTASGASTLILDDPLSGGPDQWVQDAYETGYQSMPAPGENGDEFIIYCGLNSPRPRPAIYYVPYSLWGVDFGYIQLQTAVPSTHDSFGNLEVTPPYSGYPLGRVYIGGNGVIGHCAETKAFLNSQVQGDYLEINTTWLAVGHVDEFICFLPSNSPRGWALVLASPANARTILQNLVNAGQGALSVFAGKSGYATTVSDLLNFQVSLNQSCQTSIDTVRAQLKTLFGLADSEIIDLPVLFYDAGGGYACAHSVGVVNMLVMGNYHVIIPETFGPMYGGVDAFKADINPKLAAIGNTVHYVDDWDVYHAMMGEIHCGTGTVRTPSFGGKWWSIINK